MKLFSYKLWCMGWPRAASNQNDKDNAGSLRPPKTKPKGGLLLGLGKLQPTPQSSDCRPEKRADSWPKKASATAPTGALLPLPAPKRTTALVPREAGWAPPRSHYVPIVFPAEVPVATGTKQRLSKVDLEGMACPPPFAVSELKDATGFELTLSATRECGSTGKFRLAVDNKTGEAFAVKDLRSDLLPPQGRINAAGRQRRWPCAGESIAHEVMMSFRANSAVAVQRVIDVRGKIFLVSNLAQAGARPVLRGVPAAWRADVAAFFSQRLAHKVAALHAKNIVHGDLKLDNVVFHNGDVALTDFGSARKLTASGDIADVEVPATFPAPELLTGERCTDAIDTWAFGVTALQCSAADKYRPFNYFADFGEDEKNVLGYAGWYNANSEADGRFDLFRLEDDPTYWGGYFRDIEAQDATRCHYILRHILVPDASKRATMADVATFLDARAAETSMQDTPAYTAAPRQAEEVRALLRQWLMVSDQEDALNTLRAVAEYRRSGC
jgi:hypothetical protein